MRLTQNLRPLIAAGLLVAALLIFVSVIGQRTDVAGDRIALAASLVLGAIPVLCPTMLREDAKNVSAMRVLAYLLVAVFAVVMLRSAWSAKTLADVTLDRWWCALLTAAIGGKVAQSFSEPATPTTAERPKTPPELPRR